MKTSRSSAAGARWGPDWACSMPCASARTSRPTGIQPTSGRRFSSPGADLSVRAQCPAQHPGPQPLHRRWWINDPDCLLVRQEDTRLTPAEVQTLATVLALSGGSLIVSDDLPALAEERVEWLARLLPPLQGRARGASTRSIPIGRLRSSSSSRALPGVGGCARSLNWDEAPRSMPIDLRRFGSAGGGHLPVGGSLAATSGRVDVVEPPSRPDPGARHRAACCSSWPALIRSGWAILCTSRRDTPCASGRPTATGCRPCWAWAGREWDSVDLAAGRNHCAAGARWRSRSTWQRAGEGIFAFDLHLAEHLHADDPLVTPGQGVSPGPRTRH